MVTHPRGITQHRRYNPAAAAAAATISAATLGVSVYRSPLRRVLHTTTAGDTAFTPFSASWLPASSTIASTSSPHWPASVMLNCVAPMHFTAVVQRVDLASRAIARGSNVPGVSRFTAGTAIGVGLVVVVVVSWVVVVVVVMGIPLVRLLSQPTPNAG